MKTTPSAAAALLVVCCYLTAAHGWHWVAPTRCGTNKLASSSRNGISSCQYPSALSTATTSSNTKYRRRRTMTPSIQNSKSRQGTVSMVAGFGGNWAGDKLMGGRGDGPTPAAQAFSNGKELKLGVLLLNLGGPERQEDVEPFLYNLFADPDIIRLPKLVSFMQGPIAKVLSMRRAPQSKSAYESIGGGSPIVTWTNAQAKGIADILEEKGLRGAKCYVGMRYWHPFTEAALEEIEKDGVNALVILPLYPQFSISTSGSSLRVLNEEFTRRPEQWSNKKVVHTVVSSYHDRPGYVNAMANLVAQEVAQFTPEQQREGVQVLFSAHGVPKSYIDAGDPYQAQIESCVRLISERVDALYCGREEGVKGAAAGAVSYHLSYQSRVGPVEWLRPYTDSKIQELAAKGSKNLVVVPVSFVSEHIETLEEIDMEYRELAEEAGIVNWRRVPALNTDPAFIQDMADMVVEALALPTLTVSEAFTRNNCDRKDDQDGFLERLVQNAPFFGVPTAEGAGTSQAAMGEQGGDSGASLDPQQQQSGGKKGSKIRAAQALSTISGAAFVTDGMGREIANMFPSDGIFFP